MFVVRQQTTKTPEIRTYPEETRAAATQRQRSRPQALFPNVTGRSGSRGEDTTVTRPGSQITATSTAGGENLPAPAAAATEPPSASANGMDRLLDAMSRLGMSTAGLQISYSENIVGYPSGSYVNRLINVTSNGKTEHFSADLTAKNPLVTAYELQRYFGVAARGGVTSGNQFSG